MRQTDRRTFMKGSIAVGTGLVFGTVATGAEGTEERIAVGVMGLSRGAALAQGFAAATGARVKYVCDVDEKRLGPCLNAVEKKQGTAPEGVKDFRRILDDKDVQALIVAAPDHWHAPAAILACKAGKHVYVEKPASHNAREGELMLEVARKNNRVVQVGTQRRSWEKIIEAMAKLKEGAIGKVYLSKGWYTNSRGSIGKGKEAPVPAGLDYELWEGPAPHRPYRDNVVHYNWHWFWHWGTGELGNNGIHSLDLCRWGLGVNYPRRVTSGGGRYHFQDDWETPDTQTVTYDFGDKCITWEGRSCQPRGIEGSMFGVAFYGDQGTLVSDGSGYAIYDLKNKEVSKVAGRGGDAVHIQNFLDCIRSGQRPRADVEEGVKSTLLCHLGNIAQRSGRTVNCDVKTGRVVGDDEAAKLWGREYRSGWEKNISDF